MSALLDCELQDALDSVQAERHALAAAVIERTVAGEPMAAVIAELAGTSGWSPFELTLAVADTLTRHRADT